MQHVPARTHPKTRQNYCDRNNNTSNNNKETNATQKSNVSANIWLAWHVVAK